VAVQSRVQEPGRQKPGLLVFVSKKINLWAGTSWVRSRSRDKVRLR
jgi:hypothetical protein